ncbi:hypothetical protein RhiirA1_541364 [Rhizophagus irregularis]|uniref:NF-X1-type domain-containing protein n=1 Tax=Rhizophagus irregularis TaxID=588596 RepID=A0A2N0R3N1_9GLOM|nr:hypothetical protein RhiirA1_541364 [Rhizophagus irregularis]
MRERNTNGSANFRGGRDRQNEADRNNNMPPELSIPERKRLQQRTTIENFKSSKLTYGGSDHLVFIISGERITTVWKNKLKKSPWHQNDVRIFISSALVTADSQIASELVSKLSDSENGLKKLKEIIKFPMSCNAGLKEGVLSFQYVVLPLLGLLTRTAITKCTLEKHVDTIYMTIYENLDLFLNKNVMKMLEKLVQRNSIEDNCINVDALLLHERYSFIPSSLGIFFLIIVRFVAELLRRIKEASANETMQKIVLNLRELTTKYHQTIEQHWSSLSSTDPLNNSEIRKYFFKTLGNEIDEIDAVIEELNNERNISETYGATNESSNDYEKRHNNDFDDISKISIIPTEEEILCDQHPYLPSLFDERHSLPNGAAKLLDRQFRLLREDMLNPIRGVISNFLSLLSRNYYFSLNNNGRLSNELMGVLDKGKFTYNNSKNDINDNGDLQVYANIEFINIGCDKRGLFCTLKFTPKHNSTSLRQRRIYWQNSRKLLSGNLVALLLPNPNFKQSPSDINGNIPMNDSELYSIYFGVIMSRDEITDDHIRININFDDPSIYPIALNKVSKFRNSIMVNDSNNSTKKKTYLVESTNIYFEAYYHVLKTLKTTYSLPLKRYLAPELDHHQANVCIDVKVKPPKYTEAPRFLFDLSVLCNDKQQCLTLNVANTHTYDDAAKKINENSRLDESQAKAVISALTREIALIEGPPGTGKTVVGIEIMKVLLAENNRANIGPILTICFTNHALDQFLEHLLDQDITKNIVRLGTRTKSERIKDFMLGKVKPKNSEIPILVEAMKDIEKEVDEIKSSFKCRVTWSDVSDYLKDGYREFYNKFSNITHIDLPGWVLGDYNAEETDEDSEIDKDFQDSNDEETDDEDFYDDSDDEIEKYMGKFQIVQRKQSSIFERWLKGEDMKRIDETIRNWSNHEEIDSDDDEFFDEYDEIQYAKNYEKPNTDRPIDVLLKDYSIWRMSREERQKLHNYWRAKLDEVRLLNLQTVHEECRQELNNIYDEARRHILLNSDVIGMTTSGAAKFQNLIKYIDPKIIICEEAGEVLEAHILSALTPSTQHLILIGDHNQLRPHVATYSLSMESDVGENYQLDKSLFERLVDGNNTVRIDKTRLLTQRRMRGDISDLIRYTIYDDLEDGENTTNYPNIRGVQHNVYFIDHRYREDNSAMQSHVNMFEVEMVVEMVKYFVKYGYTKPEDIAVLTPYLGQMSKIREALSESFAVDIDERDAQDMDDMEEEKINTPKSLNQRVTLRTVDNFQGEEANIVIISLVRNYSGKKYSSIGFLKSKNRSNVLLSRAREGMYLIGNADLMASKSEYMWAPVVNILRERNQVGPGMPIVCNHHLDCKNIITTPEQFDEVCSPTGGCRSTCDMPLSCGHTCTEECHFNNLDHNGVKCRKPCEKLHSECGHQCRKLCYKDCDICSVPVGNITLPCGHTFQNAECWQNKIKEDIRCKTVIDIVLSDCGHPLQNIECWRVQNEEKFICHFLIDITLPDCGHPYQDVECWKVQNNEKFTCHFPIDITLPCGHISNIECWKRKFKDSLKCSTSTDITLPDCGHVLHPECWRVQNREKFTCDHIVDITLPCGHILPDVECRQNKTKGKIKCNIIIDITLPGCGHPLQNVECWRVQNKEKFKCLSQINILLDCGHPYRNVECWRVQSKEIFTCHCKIDIKLPCGHIVRDECWRKHVKETIKCKTPISDKMPCGHMLKDIECWKVQNGEFTCHNLVDITLPCEHTLKNAECWQNKTKGTIKCETTIDTVLPDCGHTLKNVECWKVQSKMKFTCNFPVKKKLPCGHTFNIKCCIKDQTENIPKCNHLVDIKLPCGHTSRSVDCWKIKDNVEIKCITPINFTLPCGHILEDIRCWQSKIENIPKCNILGNIEFPCGHTVKNVECWKKATIKCTEQIEISVPRCEHINVIQCSELVNGIQCRNNCGIQLECGHECLNKCIKCQENSIPRNSKIKNKLIERINHGECKSKCNRSLYCGHMCDEKCSHKGECRPCNSKCAVSCDHKTCSKDCLEPCAVCAKKCSWECRHRGKCELSCGIPCDRLPCNERCDKKARCGHNCAGICGEICPTHCGGANCVPNRIRYQVSDIFNKTTFSKVDWNKERMVALPCGHIYTMKSMDKLMEMKEYYGGSIERGWTLVKSLPTSTIIKRCPACQTSIRNIRRYGRIIKNYTLEIQNKKFITKYDGELIKIDKRIIASFNEMKRGRKKLKKDLCDISKFKNRIEFKVINKGLPEITPYQYFEGIAQYHGFDENSQQVWLSHVNKLLRSYYNLIPIIRAAKNTPHKKAFEANLNTTGGSRDLTYKQQLDHKVYSIYVDGVLKVIDIQKILHDEILFIIQELSLVTKDVTTIKELWKKFDEILKQSIQNHLRLIKDVAKSTDYGSYSLLVNVEILECDFIMLRNPYSNNSIDKAEIIKKCEDIKRNIKDISENSSYVNAEEKFKKSILDRLDKLWDNCDRVI